MRTLFRTTAIVALMVLSATAIFAQTSEVDPGTGTIPGGTKLTIKAIFPTPTNLNRIITSVGGKVTWNNNGSYSTQTSQGEQTGEREFTIGFMTPLIGSPSNPLWITYEVWGFNDNNTFGYGTDGTYYLQSNNDVLYITSWKYTYQVEGEGNDDI